MNIIINLSKFLFDVILLSKFLLIFQFLSLV